MLRQRLPSSIGCPLCTARMRTALSTGLPSPPSLIRHRGEAPLQTVGQLLGCCRSSRGRSVGVQVYCVQALERPLKESRSAFRDEIRPPQREVPDSSIKTEDVILPQFDRSLGSVELIVAGAGPSGLAVAERVSQAGVAYELSEPAEQTRPCSQIAHCGIERCRPLFSRNAQVVQPLCRFPGVRH